MVSIIHIYFVTVYFIFGIILGSFYNVVGMRLTFEGLLAESRSHCPTCERTLDWSELVPIFSFMVQKGQCRGCKSKISPMYPIIELTTGLLFSLNYLYFGMSEEIFFGIALISCGVIIIVSDIRHRLISNEVLLIFVPIFLVWRTIFPIESFKNHLFGMVVGFVLLGIIVLVTKGGMGIGDLKYFTLLGFVFGIRQFFVLFLLATGYGAIFSIIWLLSGKANRKTKIPFGPFISLAAITTLYFGENLITWYTNLF